MNYVFTSCTCHVNKIYTIDMQNTTVSKLNELELSLLARPFTNRRNARLVLQFNENHGMVLYSIKDITLVVDRPNEEAIVYEIEDKNEAIVEVPKSQNPRAQIQP